MSSTQKILFNIREYSLSHNKTPKGRGSWAFRIHLCEDASRFVPIQFTPSMTYSDAKKFMTNEVKTRFPEFKWITLNVLP